MTITKRLLLTLSLALIGTLFVGIYGLLQLQRSERRFDAIQTQVIPNMEGLNLAKGALADMRLAVYRISVFSTLSDKTELDGALTRAGQSLDAAIAKYESTIGDNPAERALIARDKANVATYRLALVPYLIAAHAGDMDAVRASLMPGTPLAFGASAVTSGLNQHIAYNSSRAGQMRIENTEAYDFAFKLLVAVIAISIVLTGLLAIHLYRIIRTSLADIETTLQNVSSSLDLTLRAPVTRNDEIGLTAIAFNALMTRVMDVLHTVRAGTDAVGRAAKEIAAGNMDLSSRTEQQAAALEETASSMEQLTATVKQNSDHAREASMLAGKASAIAEKGNAVVSKVVGTMHGIASSSSHINEITGVIEGIAFQTNILALNAAVEAARAGEQGRGFAVVASEVRNLAQRSSTAAKEIKDLIADSERQVLAGSTLVEEAGQTMLDITHSIKQVTDIMAEIAIASEEQQRGIEQINRAITEMDTVTQQNAALVEEAAAASQALQDQGEQLDDAVAVFGLGGPLRAARPTMLSLSSASTDSYGSDSHLRAANNGYGNAHALRESNGA